jgi:hypothetical protein
LPAAQRRLRRSRGFWSAQSNSIFKYIIRRYWNGLGARDAVKYGVRRGGAFQKSVSIGKHVDASC